MSVDDLRLFFEKLETDERLRAEAIALDGASNEERLRALYGMAAREGFAVDDEDWQHASVGPAVAALSDDALRDVIGAGCEDGAGLFGGSLGLSAGGCGDQSLGLAGGGCSDRSLGFGSGGCG